MTRKNPFSRFYRNMIEAREREARRIVAEIAHNHGLDLPRR